MATRYWVGGGSSSYWNATGPTNWGTASNTQDNASVPGSSDDVIFDGVGTGACNSIAQSQDVKSINCAGYSNTLYITNFCQFRGNVYFSEEMTLTVSYRKGIGIYNASCVLTTNGQNLQFLYIDGASANITLGSDLNIIGTVDAGFQFRAGAFDANDYNVSFSGYQDSGNYAKTLRMGNGTWDINWSLSKYLWYGNNSATRLNVISEGSTLHFSKFVTTAQIAFDLNSNYEFNIIKCTPYDTTGGRTISFESNFTCNQLIIDEGGKFTVIDGKTVTISDIVVNSTESNNCTLGISGAYTNGWNLIDTIGTNEVENTIINSCNASGGAEFLSYLEDGNTDDGNNTGWIFELIPESSGNFFILFN